MDLLPPRPEPRFVLAGDGTPIATYDLGDPDGPVVLAVHGFASSAWANFVVTGWTRDLGRAGFRVLAIDQRGHGASGKPHDPAAYAMDRLVADVRTVLDTRLVDEAAFVGYSLGARVGWQAALELGAGTLPRAVLGGLPQGDPLTRFDLAGARASIADGTPAADELTRTYLTMAAQTPSNDPTALVALVEGMRGGPQAEPARPPQQPVLLAAGTEDPVLPGARRLAAAAPHGDFVAVPGRDHFNAPTSRAFRAAAIAFLQRG